jgi:hypothetical protein
MNSFYWHTLSNKEQRLAQKSRLNIKGFRQPPWCHYPKATENLMGCWSLMLGKIHRRLDCKSCSLECKNARNAKRLGFDWDCYVIPQATVPLLM